MTLLDYAKRSWGLVNQLPPEHREQEFVILMRYLAEAGVGLDQIPVTEEQVRLALVHAPLTLEDPSKYWGYAQQAGDIGLVWIWLGQMDAALVLRGLNRAAIGVDDPAIGRLLSSLRRP